MSNKENIMRILFILALVSFGELKAQNNSIGFRYFGMHRLAEDSSSKLFFEGYLYDSVHFQLLDDKIVRTDLFGYDLPGFKSKLRHSDTLWIDSEVAADTVNSFITSGFSLLKTNLSVLCFDKGEYYRDTIEVILAEGFVDEPKCKSRRIYCVHPLLGVLGYLETEETYSKCHEFDYTDINGFRYYRFYASRETMSILKTLSAKSLMMENVTYTKAIPWRFVRSPSSNYKP